MELLDFSSWQMWLVLGIGLVVTVAVLALVTRPQRQPSEIVTEPETDLGKHDPFVHGHQNEKRVAFRRKGGCIEVVLSDETGKAPPSKGWVMDRSVGGLQLAVDRTFPVGEIITVRIAELADTMPWIEVEVIHCQPRHQGWEVGCRFIRIPTWNMLLLFG
jgi:hypothetical protein